MDITRTTLQPSNTHSIQIQPTYFNLSTRKESNSMSDQNNTQPRIFKTGAVRIVEDESMRGLDNEAIRSLLKATYPEIANATIREVTTDDGQKVVEFLPQPGRKG
jgi:hypothetical protein